jgi:hypothetical protein
MYWDVVEVRPKGGCSLWVRFADGVSGVIRLNTEDLTGVLAPLRDPEFFGSVYVDHGAVSWPGEIDLAPDAMYKEIQNSSSDAISAEPNPMGSEPARSN